MDINRIKEDILCGNTCLGIELGSTRIKVILTDSENTPIAAGNHEWENRLEDGIWTYTLDDIWSGLQASYKKLAGDVNNKYGMTLKTVGTIGLSAMMHGYMAFDNTDRLLVPFRTWRNTITGEAADKLSEEFNFNIPQRWSIAHLYQAILNNEDHVKDIAFFTTLAGYVHRELTGEKVLGIGDASGMFPIDSARRDYNETMIAKFDRLVAHKKYSWNLREILPKVLPAGAEAGKLTESGAKLLDTTGTLEPGILFCPPEGDAGTGMTATNSVAVHTGNVSAGTSVFSMVVLEKPLSKAYKELDLVTTPAGDAVAMVHCNNCTSDLNAWVGIFREFTESIGSNMDTNILYEILYKKALEGDKDCGGLMSYCYLSGEPVIGLAEGRPLFVRKPDSKFSLANFMRTHLYTCLGVLKIGNDILTEQENVKIDRIMGHGGLFKTEGVGQSIMAAALNTPVALMETAGEGGAWGIALLASYMKNKKPDESLESFLADKVFAGKECNVINPNPDDVEGFNKFIKRYMETLSVEQAAVEMMK